MLDGAILTNPYSHKQMDRAIESALELPQNEQIERINKMVSAVEEFTVDDWAKEQMQSLETMN